MTTKHYGQNDRSPTSQAGRDKTESSPADAGGTLINISFYTRVNRPAEKKTITISEFLEIIKSDKYKAECEKLRATKDKDERQKLKFEELPCVCVQGVFSYRNNDKLTKASGFAVIDFDIYDSSAPELKQKLSKDPHVYAAFLSPSGGVKAIIKIEEVNDDERYKQVYDKLLNHYKRYNPNTDKTNKDISRLCYLSHDPKLYVNENAKEFKWGFVEKKRGFHEETLKNIRKADDNIKQKTKEGKIDRSRREYQELIKLIARGYNKQQVFERMMAFDKWAHPHHINYREHQYKNAYAHVESKKNSSQDEHGFILDSSKVLAKKLFVFDKLTEDTAAFGVMLPKWKDIYDTKGKFVRRMQIDAPALITSKREIIPVGSQINHGYKISFREIPSSMRLRWELESINAFANGKTKAKKLEEIFHKIREQYDKYLSMPENWLDAHTLWDMATYYFPLFKVFPIFELRGLAGTAKSKCMSISSMITFNATNIMVNPSEPTLFRETNDKRPTKYIDEAENLFKVNNGRVEPDPRVEVINSSYRYDGSVPRQERLYGKFQTVYYKTYSPTMVASINGLYGATENRAIIRIATKPKNEDKEKGNLEHEPEHRIWQDIRNELYISTLEYWQIIDDIYQTQHNDTDLVNRDYWLWKPLLILAKEISDSLYTRVLKTALKQQETKQADFIPEDSNEYRILAIVCETIQTEEKVYVKDIHDKLPESQYKPREKTISSKLDKLGFRDFRGKDRDGSYFKLSSQLFESIIMPICPSIYSSHSSHSSQKNDFIDDKQKKINVMNSDECDEYSNKIIKKGKMVVTNVTKMTNVTNNSTVGGEKKPNLYQTIKRLDQGNGADINEIIAAMQEAKYTKAQFNEFFNYAKSTGVIFEVRHGWWKVSPE